ncbi:chemotaxis protein CheD [Propionivibrio limicola]|uniref:chemotaxis protein CheD n=1 Tax=Propionivibrio limicola TaxID=167645 RepID=UPI0012922140|nr:chemotaxis protein CheD [Propionivibrio limicola]
MSCPLPSFPRKESVKNVMLQPGDFFFGGGDTRISTLLGSCVSITFWHPHQRIGGMCHYMLTERAKAGSAALDGRYASEAFALFLRHVDEAATRPLEYQAKIFGGANMFVETPGASMDIGARNIEYGVRLLASRHISIVSRHVGGSGRRKLHFDLWSGDVWLAFPDGSGAEVEGAAESRFQRVNR